VATSIRIPALAGRGRQNTDWGALVTRLVRHGLIGRTQHDAIDNSLGCCADFRLGAYTRSWRPLPSLNPATTPRPAASADVASVRPASDGADDYRREVVTPQELDHHQPPLHREAQSAVPNMPALRRASPTS
jgi:hypothetical protein